jgi:hypothetical protein
MLIFFPYSLSGGNKPAPRCEFVEKRIKIPNPTNEVPALGFIIITLAPRNNETART